MKTYSIPDFPSYEQGFLMIVTLQFRLYLFFPPSSWEGERPGECGVRKARRPQPPPESPLPTAHMGHSPAPLLLCIWKGHAHAQGDLWLVFRNTKRFLAVHISHFSGSAFISNKAALRLCLFPCLIFVCWLAWTSLSPSFISPVLLRPSPIFNWLRT